MAAQNDDPAFKCPFCGRGYEGQDELTTHFEDGHGMEGFAAD